MSAIKAANQFNADAITAMFQEGEAEAEFLVLRTTDDVLQWLQDNSPFFVNPAVREAIASRVREQQVDGKKLFAMSPDAIGALLILDLPYGSLSRYSVLATTTPTQIWVNMVENQQMLENDRAQQQLFQQASSALASIRNHQAESELMGVQVGARLGPCLGQGQMQAAAVAWFWPDRCLITAARLPSLPAAQHAAVHGTAEDEEGRPRTGH